MLSVCLAAGLDGIQNEIAPPQAVTENVFKMRLCEKKKLGIESLPGDLGEAIAEFEKDAYIREILGEHISMKYPEAKKAEWQQYQTQVTEWEINEYLYKI